MELVLSFFLGAAASWVITHFYYRRSAQDAQDGLLEARLDKCIEGDLTFLVALYMTGKPVPRYANISVEHERLDGTTQTWASSMGTMVRSIEHRVEHCTVTHGGNRIDEDKETVTLSDRGRQCAEYLLRTKYRWARFDDVDDSEEVRRRLFRHERKRDPQIHESSANQSLDRSGRSGGNQMER